MAKRCLITGGAGFIGHHIIDYLIYNTDWEIVSLDRLDFSGNLNRLHDISKSYKWNSEDKKRISIVWHDIKAEISDLTANMIGPVDIILHLAAASHVDRSITHPMEFVLDNTVGTVNMLEFARKQKNLERFIFFGTDEVFGVAPEGVNFKEWDRYNSTNPYSASKAAAEEFCVAYENTFNLPIYIVHTMNVFGERQHPEKFIPMVIRKIRDGEMIQIHSDPTVKKPGSRFYINAQEVADALYFLLGLDSKKLNRTDKYGAKCPKFNIAGKEEVSNLRVVTSIAKHMNKTAHFELVDFHTSRPGHDLRYSLSGEYMKSLGWQPRYSFDEEIKYICYWYLEHPEWLECN